MLDKGDEKVKEFTKNELSYLKDRALHKLRNFTSTSKEHNEAYTKLVEGATILLKLMEVKENLDHEQSKMLTSSTQS